MLSLLSVVLLHRDRGRLQAGVADELNNQPSNGETGRTSQKLRPFLFGRVMHLDVLEAPVAIKSGTVEAHIGHTPLLRLRLRNNDLCEGVEVFAKAEHLNPGGSVKDRAALSMILAGERSGRLKPGMTILDATSGNTGIAYAMIGASRGYAVKVCLPKNATPARKRILRSYGVEIVETDPMLSTDGAQLIARAIFADNPEKYF